MKIKSLEEFVSAASKMDAIEISNMFEFDTAKAVQNEIYEFADNASPEPFRAAMIEIGALFEVQSLINY